MASTPYDFGFRPWSQVINEAGNTINSGIDSAIASAKETQAKNERDDELNRALHPATAKWLQKVMTGEMSPAEASTAAHQEIDALGKPSEAPMVGSPGASAPASLSKLAEPGDQGSTGAGTSVSMGRGPTAPRPGLRQVAEAPMRPMTVRDAMDAEKLAPLMQAQRPPTNPPLTPEEWDRRQRLLADNKVKLEDTKQGGRRDLATINNNSREGVAARRLELDWWTAMHAHQDKLATLEAMLQRAREGRSSNEEIAKAKILSAQLIANLGVVGKIDSSMNADQDQATQDKQRAVDEIAFKTKQIAGQLGLLDAKPGEPTGPFGPPSPPKAVDPSALPQRRAPQVGAPSSITISTSKRTETAATPKPMGVFKTDASGTKWEKMSDGTARKVR